MGRPRVVSGPLTFLLDGVEHVLVISAGAELLDHAGLTPAERAVASDLLRGLSNRRIAERRGVAERTVANQVGAIYRKLGVSSRIELARKMAGAPEPAADGTGRPPRRPGVRGRRRAA